jgi:hypothetical protein
MNEKEEIKEIFIPFKNHKHALTLVGYGVSWNQIGNFNRSVQSATNLDEYVRLGAAAVGIYFEYFKFEIVTHYLVLTEIGETLALIAFPKSAGKFTDDHKERIKYLLQLKYKNTSQKELLEKIGSVSYRPPKQNSSGHIVITDKVLDLFPKKRIIFQRFKLTSPHTINQICPM